ncbi:hypothetical protein BUALT_Bualt03G0138500 [Buddleja alternifolia]|uniref:Uncharacterized protein n=1 Tax=Buddleja alternifolia TaxID=168488 RepID=A0AAV6XVU6_9LAMI|nr:hypothetical protein BUALT_Bualt03G0138500 [Buddleja alternifolia]
MFPSKRAVVNLGNGVIHANPLYLLFQNKYVAGFTSISDINKGPTTPDKLSNKDATIKGSEGGYGGSGISISENEASGIPKRGEESGKDNGGEGVTKDTEIGAAAKDTVRDTTISS